MPGIKQLIGDHRRFSFFPTTTTTTAAEARQQLDDALGCRWARGSCFRDCTVKAKPKSCYKWKQEHICPLQLVQVAFTGFSLPVGIHSCPRGFPFPPSFCCFPFSTNTPLLQSRDCPDESGTAGTGFYSTASCPRGGAGAGTKCYRCGKIGDIARARPNARRVASFSHPFPSSFPSFLSLPSYPRRPHPRAFPIFCPSSFASQNTHRHASLTHSFPTATPPVGTTPRATATAAPSAEGHISRDCTQAQKRACYTCLSEGHISRDCSGVTEA
ncbi:hypothetical protein K438DRAFT_1999664 [Mycena galopus ATCC 62051]|nr:hypothetical protein K438DRAFT_1999664 [Mycena galopus ATCC 62051]